MKKLLSLLLALIMCLVAFISCGDETESSSEPSSEKINPKSKITTEKQYDYYRFLGYFKPSVDDNLLGETYRIITSYEDFSNYVESPEKLDSSIFESNYIFLSHRRSITTFDINWIGYRDLYVEDSILYLYREKAPVWSWSESFGNYVFCYAIPKSEISIDEILTISDIKIIDKDVAVIEPLYEKCNFFELENGTSFVLTNKQEMDEFSEIYLNNEAVYCLPNSFVVAIYHEDRGNMAIGELYANGDKIITYGHEVDKVENNTIYLSETVLINSHAEEPPRTAYFYMVQIPLDVLDSPPTADMAVHITVKENHVK